MVVHHAHGLHESVADGGTDETEAAALERLAHGLGDRRRGRDVFQPAPGVYNRRAAAERPQEFREANARLSQFQPRLSIRNCRPHLEAVAHDARVFQKQGNFSVAVPCDTLRVEAVESLPISLPLPQDGVPAQARLRPLENQHLEEPAVVAQGDTPFLIVVGHVERIIGYPAATCVRRAQ